jgi:hypothetical protein
VWRYDGPGPDATSLRVLAAGFNACCADAAVTLSPDGRLVYFAQSGGRVYAIDADTGASEFVADFSELSDAFSLGATVYAPDPDLIPGRCCFGVGTASAGCLDGVTRPQCGDDEPGLFIFTPKESCPPQGFACAGACCNTLIGECLGVTLETDCAGAEREWIAGANCEAAPCTPVTGACCSHDPFLPCSEGVFFDCQCATCLWHQHRTCGEIGCKVTTIPAASAWGLTTLTLSMLIGAKLVFGQSHTSA